MDQSWDANLPRRMCCDPGAEIGPRRIQEGHKGPLQPPGFGMKYARLGNSGLIVSQYVWGAANIGTPLPQFAAAPHLDEDTVKKAAAVALDRGVNFFDTADLYSDGAAEEILGRVLAGH